MDEEVDGYRQPQIHNLNRCGDADLTQLLKQSDCGSVAMGNANLTARGKWKSGIECPLAMTFHLCAHVPVQSSVGIEDEPWKGAVLVAVAPVSLASVQFYENLIACIQMKDDTVAGVVITLVLVLGDGARPDLEYDMHTHTHTYRSREDAKRC